MKTLYLTDLDGTLLNGSAELSEYAAQTLNRLIGEGLHFSVATARTAATAARILAGLDLRLPIILQGGVLIWDPLQARYIQSYPMTLAAMRGIVAAARGLGQSGLMYTLRGQDMRTYYETLDTLPLRDFVDARVAKYNKVFLQVNDFVGVLEDVLSFTFLDTRERIDALQAALGNLGGIAGEKSRDVYSNDLWFLELYRDQASKYDGAQFLRQYGGYDRVVGFGDNFNDLPLFRACDESYAVANAREELKAVATGVIGSNLDDGVVRWLAGVDSQLT